MKNLLYFLRIFKNFQVEIFVCGGFANSQLDFESVICNSREVKIEF